MLKELSHEHCICLNEGNQKVTLKWKAILEISWKRNLAESCQELLRASERFREKLEINFPI